MGEMGFMTYVRSVILADSREVNALLRQTRFDYGCLYDKLFIGKGFEVNIL